MGQGIRAWGILAASLLVLAAACERGSGQRGKSEEWVFQATSAKLAAIPQGYELGEAVFRNDGKRVAFTAWREKETVVVLDGAPGRAYEDAGEIVFRKGRTGFAYRAKKAEKECVVTDGKEGTWYDGVAKLAAAPDGRIIYEAAQGGAWMVVSGNRKGRPYTSHAPSPVISADGSAIAFLEPQGAGKASVLQRCTIDLETCASGKPYGLVEALTGDPSRMSLAYIAGIRDKRTVVEADFIAPVLREREHGWYDEVFSLGLSDRGQHVAFLARRADAFLLVRDGVETPAPRPLSPLVMSRQGRTFYAAGGEEQVSAVVDGAKTGGVYNEIAMPAFSPDGSRLAFAARRGAAWFIVVDGREGPAFDRVVTPRFSKDGSRLIYRVRRQGERFVVVADAEGRTVREHPHYEAVWDPVFSPDGRYVGYGIAAGRELWWKVEPLQ